MYGLGKEVGNNVAGKVQSLIAGPVAARGAATWLEDVSEHSRRRGRRDARHGGARAEVVVKDAVGSGRQRRGGAPNVLSAFPQDLIHGRRLVVDLAVSVTDTSDRGEATEHHAADAEVLRESGAAGARAAGPRREAGSPFRGGLQPPDGEPGGGVLWAHMRGAATGRGVPFRREASGREPSENVPRQGGTVGRAGSLAKSVPNAGGGPTLNVAPPGGKRGAKGTLAKLGEARRPGRVVEDRARSGGGRAGVGVGRRASVRGSWDGSRRRGLRTGIIVVVEEACVVGTVAWLLWWREGR